MEKSHFQWTNFWGAGHAEGTYRTTATSMIFFELEEISDRKERLVALTGIEPVYPP